LELLDLMWKIQRAGDFWTMKKITSSAPRMTGFTLIELMIVVVIAAILASLAAPSFRDLIENQRIRAASGELYMSLALARSEAIKRNTDITLASVGGNWASGWQIAHPADPSKFIEEHGAVSNFTITTAPDTPSVIYQGTGRIKPGPGSSVTLTLAGKAAANKRCVSVDPSGRPMVKSC
jgi:type IV fimbrial biogenesis protein FimT